MVVAHKYHEEGQNRPVQSKVADTEYLAAWVAAVAFESIKAFIIMSLTCFFYCIAVVHLVEKVHF